MLNGRGRAGGRVQKGAAAVGMNGYRLNCLFLLPLLLAGGCAHYQARPLSASAVEEALSVPADQVVEQRARRMEGAQVVHLADGISPQEAAVVAVVVNPSLRAQRDHNGLAQAQLIQAGILPNPQLDLSIEPVTGGNTQDTQAGWGAGLGWEISSLITRDARVKEAKQQARSVRLDVAWSEWQVAQGARQAVYDLVSLRAQLDLAEAVDRRLKKNLDLIHRETEAHRKTLLDWSAAETASRAAHADVLSRRRDMAHQRLVLSAALGLPPGREIKIQSGIELPDHLDLPSQTQLLHGLGKRRLDLRALRAGYESQEEAVRGAILGQFPKIGLSFSPASDTSNVHTVALGVSIDLPIFDRNQGTIAVERATRRQLFDEYIQRLFEARSAVARAMGDIQALTAQIADARAALPALNRLVKAYQSSVDHGNADILSYYGAINDLNQKQIEVLQFKQQLMDNKIALEIAAGTPLDAVAALTEAVP
jgi:outer membrane protein TolC